MIFFKKDELKLLWPFYFDALIISILFIIPAFSILYFLGIGLSLTQIGLGLISENQRYREATQKKWNCITPIGLDNAVNGLDKYVELISERNINKIEDYDVRQYRKEDFDEQRTLLIGDIKKWFSDNYSNLIYDTRGKIPYGVIKKMQGKLNDWATKNINPFYESLESFI